VLLDQPSIPLMCVAASQGAGVAASVCLMAQVLRQPDGAALPGTGAAAGVARDCTGAAASQALRFAILCSGYASAVEEHRRLLREHGPLRIPSLHIFAGGWDCRRDLRGAPGAAATPAAPQAPGDADAMAAGASYSCQRSGSAAEGGLQASGCCPARGLTVDGGVCEGRSGVEVGGTRGGSGGAALVGDEGGGESRQDWGDRQVPTCTSVELLDMFALEGRRVVRHASGHVVPADKAHAEQYRAFLDQFLD
jgi:Serine hydrolase (FSH1)